MLHKAMNKSLARAVAANTQASLVTGKFNPKLSLLLTPARHPSEKLRNHPGLQR